MKNNTIYWLIINGFFATSMYFGFFQEVEAAESLAVFIAWLSIIVSLFLQGEAVQEELKKKGRSVPKEFNILFDIGATAALVYGGWWITAFLYVIHSFLQEEAIKKALEEE